MAEHSPTLSFARGLTFIISIMGFALLLVVAFAGQSNDQTARIVGMSLLALPFLLGLVAHVLPIATTSRVVLLWLCAAGAGTVGAITIFSGIGVFLFAIALAYLWAAWIENRDAA